VAIQNLELSACNFIIRVLWRPRRCEGTGRGNRPDYFADTQIEGPLRQKKCAKRQGHPETAATWGWGCGRRGHGDKNAVLEPNTNAQRLPLLSHLLRSACDNLEPDFCSFKCSRRVPIPLTLREDGRGLIVVSIARGEGKFVLLQLAF